jgi:hypothetical protein
MYTRYQLELSRKEKERFFDEAAALGYPKAMVMVSTEYEKTQRAADLGFASAQCFMGSHYTDKNKDLARYYYGLAAEQGAEWAITQLKKLD